MTEPAKRQILERRGRSRFDASELNATLDQNPVWVHDLSLTGMGVLTCDPLDPDSQPLLELSSPIGDIVSTVHVVWCDETPSEKEEREAIPVYRLGLRFPPLPPAAADLLQRLVKWQSSRQSDCLGRPEEERTSPFSEEDIAEAIRRGTKHTRDP